MSMVILLDTGNVFYDPECLIHFPKAVKSQLRKCVTQFQARLLANALHPSHQAYRPDDMPFNIRQQRLTSLGMSTTTAATQSYNNLPSRSNSDHHSGRSSLHVIGSELFEDMKILEPAPAKNIVILPRKRIHPQTRINKLTHRGRRDTPKQRPHTSETNPSSTSIDLAWEQWAFSACSPRAGWYGLAHDQTEDNQLEKCITAFQRHILDIWINIFYFYKIDDDPMKATLEVIDPELQEFFAKFSQTQMFSVFSKLRGNCDPQLLIQTKTNEFDRGCAKLIRRIWTRISELPLHQSRLEMTLVMHKRNGKKKP